MDESKNDSVAVKTSHPARMPLVLTILLLLASAGLCAYIWNSYQNMQEGAAAAAREYNTLKERETWLRSLLALSPCEAAAKISQAAKRE